MAEFGNNLILNDLAEVKTVARCLDANLETAIFRTLVIRPVSRAML